MFSYEDILQARERIKSRVVETPVLSSPMLNEMVGAELYIKAESLQLTGSFKVRGALNKVMSLTPEERERGVLAYSSGNHGHAVSAASKIVGTKATICLPSFAPAIKVANCRWWGAEVVFYDAETTDREEFGAALAKERGLTLVKPFDDYLVMAGQGTVGLELCEFLKARDIELDMMLVNCSGGGLTSGVFAAVKHHFANVEYGVVEPVGYEKVARSLSSGVPQRNDVIRPNVMDGILGPVMGAYTFPVIRDCNPTPYAVTEEEALNAVKVAFKTLKLVLEPGAAVSLAAILAGKVDVRGKKVALIGSGGNVDPEMFTRALAV